MAHPGTYFNTPTLGVTGLVPADPDTAVTFNPASNEYAAQNSTVPQQTLTAFTIGGILKPNNANDSNQPTLWGIYNNVGLMIAQAGPSGALTFYFSPGGGFTGFASLEGTTAMSDGSTYRFIATWNGTTAKLYVNGSLDGGAVTGGGGVPVSGPGGSVPFGSAEILAGGGTGAWIIDEDLNFFAATNQFGTTGNVSFDGTLDELFFVANHAATAPEIAAIDAAMTGTGDVETEINALSPYIYWRLGEPSGTAVNDSASTVLTPTAPAAPGIFADFVSGNVSISAYGRDQNLSIVRGTTSLVTTGFVGDAGHASTVLSNRDLRFDPNNLSGPYVTGGETDVVPGVPIFVYTTYNAVTYQLFNGFADEWPQEYPLIGCDQTVPLEATDATGSLNVSLDSHAPSEYTGARIQRVLTAIGWPGPVDIAHGNTIVNPLRLETVSAWSHLQDVANAEWGDLYIASDGTLTFRDRDQIATETRSSVSQATFTEEGMGGLSYSNVTMGSPPLVNHCTVVYSDTGQQVTESDAVSIAKPWGLRSINLSLPMSNASQARAYARWIVQRYGNPIATFTSVTIKPGNDPANLYPQAFGRELSDLITVERTPFEDSGSGPVPSSTISRECWIRGIRHEYSDHVWTSTTFYLQDASWIAGLFYLDVSELDGPDVLGL